MKTKLFAVFFLSLLFVVSACKKDPIEPPITPTPPVDTTYNVTFKDGIVPIVQDTIYKKYGESVTFSWELVGYQGFKFEIQKNSQHLSYEKKGTDKFLAEGQVVYNCFVNDFKTKSYVIILVSEIPFPVINITVSDTSIAYNGSANVSWNIQYSTAQYLNGAPISVTGSLQLISLKRDTILHFSASNSNGVKYTNKDVTIHVGPPPPPTPLENLQAGKWYMKVWKINGESVIIPDCQKDDYIIFFTNMWCEEHRNLIKCNLNENELMGRVDYSLYTLNDTLRLEIGGTIHNVKTLDSQNLKLYFNVPCPSCPTPVLLYEQEYTHEFP